MKLPLWLKEFFVQVGITLLSILISFVFGAVFIVIAGANPIEVYLKLFEGIFLNPYGLAQMIFKATPLIIAGLSIALGFRAGLFNIGSEGQIIVGGFLCAYVGFTFTNLNSFILIPLCLIAAFVGGALWAGIPAILRIKTGAHEVITTIMMNFIAMALTNYFITYHFHVPETVHTQSISSSAFLGRLDHFITAFKGSPANMSFVIAILLCVICWWVISKTPYGYETRAVGFNPNAAKTAGININRNLFTTFLISGGLSGLASINFIMGYKHYFEEGFSQGVGFMAIAVALVGQNNPFGIIFSALLFGALSHGTLVINALVPKDIIQILEALVIFFVISSNIFAKKYLSRIRD